tara:strand:+ start:1336 stop:2799 length:1464 start_codon:yes stop_codon:yes gene_type:complete
MSGIGNLLTTGSSTPWTPFQRNINVLLTSTISGSSEHSISYKAVFVTGSSVNSNEYSKLAAAPNNKTKYLSSATNAWLADLDGGDTNPNIQFDLNPGVGTAALDSFIIGSPTNSAWQTGGYSISGSNDATNWTALTESVTFPGASGFDGEGYDDTLTFTNSTAYRYYRVAINNYSGTYAGFAYVIGWDSSLFANQLNLFNPNQVNVTASFEDSINSSLELFTSKKRDDHGIYFDHDIGSMDINWDEPKLFRGWFGPAYQNNQFFPGSVQFFKSDTGELNDWELISTQDMNATQGPFSSAQNFYIDIGTPIKTQYLRAVFFAVGSATPNKCFLMKNGWMYEMTSAQSPPIPTNLTASAFQSNVGLTWSQNSGSDNRLIDVIYNIERSSNGGSTYNPVITLSGSVIQIANTSSIGTPVQTSYIDSNLADGTYLYRIQSQNKHHLTTSSFVASTSVTVPTTSGGGTSKKIYTTNKGNILINPNDTVLIEI